MVLTDVVSYLKLLFSDERLRVSILRLSFDSFNLGRRQSALF